MDTIWDHPLELPKTPLQGQSFARRGVAYVLDSLVNLVAQGVIFMLAGVFIAVVALILFPDREPVPQTTALDRFEWLWSLALIFTYFALFEWLYGATPGKLLLGMRVVTDRGEPCGLVAAAVRGLLRFVDALFFAIPAYAAMSSSERRQRIGDKAAHTVVVRSSDPGIVRRRSGWLFLLAALLYLLIVTAFVAFYLVFSLRLQPIQPTV